MDFLKDLGIISTGLAVGGAFLAMGWKADGLISKQASNDLSSYLLDPTREHSIKTAYLWPQIFIEFFDQVFGKKHFSFKCFFRSSIASFVAAIICAAVLVILVENSLAGGQKNEVIDFIRNEYSNFLFLFFVLNFFPDYISLLETRIIIKKIRETKSSIIRFLWVVFDLLATFIIFFIGILIVSVIFFILTNTSILQEEGISDVFGFFAQSLLTPTSFKELGLFPIYIWTTYFTSVWVWLYVTSQIITRLVGPIRNSVRFLQYLLPVDTKPLQSVCTVMAVLSCLVTWVILAPFEIVSLF